MSMSAARCAEDVIKRGCVRAADIFRLEDCLGGRGPAAADEADSLFAIQDSCPVQDTAWADFFIEAITDHVVMRREPRGYMTLPKAKWLAARVAVRGLVPSKTGLELLVAVLERARWSPMGLAILALEQVENAVRQGAGPLRAGLSAPRGAITEGETGLLRRILCALDGDRSLAITRPELEVLFAIDKAVADDQPNAAWIDLFVKAVTNALMSCSGYAAPSRREALTPGPWPSLWQGFSGGSGENGWSRFQGLTARYRAEPREDRALARIERQRIEIITNETVAAPDVGWFMRALGHGRPPTAGEGALLDTLRQSRPGLHPLLQDLVDRRAAAA